MPEYYETFEEDGTRNFVLEFEKFLDDRSTGEQGGMLVRDYEMIEIVLLLRLRSMYTLEEMHARAHVILQEAEAMLHTPGALRDPDTGEVVPPVLAENFKGSPEEQRAMLRDVGKGLDEDELFKLLQREEEE